VGVSTWVGVRTDRVYPDVRRQSKSEPTNQWFKEGGDVGGYGSDVGVYEDGIRLVMGVIISGTPIKSRTVHTFQDICIFVKYFKV
jgi:hypothetical protein